MIRWKNITMHDLRKIQTRGVRVVVAIAIVSVIVVVVFVTVGRQ